MKIIAEKRNAYIIDINITELQKLTGYFYNKRKFEVGDELKVSALYEQLTYLIKQDKEVKKIVHTLKTAAGMLEKIDPALFFYEEDKNDQD